MSELEKEPQVAPKKRLASLDALRGFDMFWIIGGGQLLRTFTETTSNTWDDAIGEQMHHVAWDGVQFYDLIFPLFMFLAGVSIPYAIGSKLEKGISRSSLILKVVKRVSILIFLGLIYNGLLDLNFETLRAASVLGQIGVAYGIAATVVVLSKRSITPVLWCVGIMVFYAVAQLAIVVPEHGAGVLTQAGSINGYVDRLLLPGRLYGGVFDPEGLLCMISASAIVLMGVQAGRLLKSQAVSEYKKTAILAGSGVVLLVLGMLIAPYYPPVKSIWTTTFNLYAGGISLISLAAFYLVIDVWNVRKPAFIFTVIGMNSIAIYMAARVINFRHISDFFFRGAINELETPYAVTFSILGVIVIQWLFLWALYKKKMFLKV